jgi:hypothetical protein
MALLQRPWERTYETAPHEGQKGLHRPMEDTHNSYNYGIAPVKVDELDANATVEKFNANELFLTSDARITSLY